MSDLAQRYQVHPNQIYAWKKQLQEHTARAFDVKLGHEAEARTAREVERLHAKIGELTIENDFFAKRCYGAGGEEKAPSLEEEDAKRPNREREHLIGKRTGIINRMKAAFVRLGIRGFNPKLRKTPERLAALRMPEGSPIPPNTLDELRREMAHLRFIEEQINQIEKARRERTEQTSKESSSAKVVQMATIKGVGIETADMLAHEVFSRDLRDQRAVARYAGLTGSPDESGSRRRDKGLAKTGNARARRGMIQLAWRFLIHQKDSALAVC